MGLMSWALEKLSKHLPENRIAIGGATYLRRFYLCGGMNDSLAASFKFGPGMRTRLGFLPTVYLHQFKLPDADRDLHNHPWEGTSFILSGGYVEERWVGVLGTAGAYKRTKCINRFTLNKIKANTYHRIDSLYNDSTWSLVVRGPKTQSWGFWDEARSRHVNHRRYKRPLP